MVPFWKCANKTIGGVAFLYILTGCASWAPLSIKTKPEPQFNHSSSVDLIKVGGLVSYLTALRQNQVAAEDINQLRHIQLRELGQQIRIETSTLLHVEIPLIASVTPPP